MQTLVVLVVGGIKRQRARVQREREETRRDRMEEEEQRWLPFYRAINDMIGREQAARSGGRVVSIKGNTTVETGSRVRQLKLAGTRSLFFFVLCWGQSQSRRAGGDVTCHRPLAGAIMAGRPSMWPLPLGTNWLAAGIFSAPLAPHLDPARHCDWAAGHLNQLRLW